MQRLFQECEYECLFNQEKNLFMFATYTAAVKMQEILYSDVIYEYDLLP